MRTFASIVIRLSGGYTANRSVTLCTFPCGNDVAVASATKQNIQLRCPPQSPSWAKVMTSCAALASLAPRHGPPSIDWVSPRHRFPSSYRWTSIELAIPANKDFLCSVPSPYSIMELLQPNWQIGYQQPVFHRLFHKVLPSVLVASVTEK